MAVHDSETIEDVKPALAAAKYFVRAATDLSYDFGAATDKGKKRSENQDHYIIIRRTRMQQLLFTNMPTEELALPADEAFAMAVADGMGGVGCGSLASQIAIRSAWDIAGRASSWVMKLQDMNSTELSERIEGFVYLMQQSFVEEYRQNPAFAFSGTTWTSAYLVSGFAAIAQIGDSPTFLWRDGTMRRVSTDHTVEQEFISCGVSPEIAGKFSHMLTRCLGYESHNARPDVHFLKLQPNDQLLICTDGLTDMVDERGIAQCLDDSKTAQSACNNLVKLALDAGGKDNVTALLARAKSR
jgi:PPM family protein phosphatase